MFLVPSCFIKAHYLITLHKTILGCLHTCCITLILGCLSIFRQSGNYRDRQPNLAPFSLIIMKLMILVTIPLDHLVLSSVWIVPRRPSCLPDCPFIQGRGTAVVMMRPIRTSHDANFMQGAFKKSTNTLEASALAISHQESWDLWKHVIYPRLLLQFCPVPCLGSISRKITIETWSGLGIETLGLVTDSVHKILHTLSATKPNVSIPNPGHDIWELDGSIKCYLK